MVRSLDLHNPGIILHISDTEMQAVSDNIFANVVKITTNRIVEEYLKNNQEKINLYLKRNLKRLAREKISKDLSEK
jgi:hypothetical protein